MRKHLGKEVLRVITLVGALSWLGILVFVQETLAMQSDLPAAWLLLEASVLALAVWLVIALHSSRPWQRALAAGVVAAISSLAILAILLSGLSVQFWFEDLPMLYSVVSYPGLACVALMIPVALWLCAMEVRALAPAVRWAASGDAASAWSAARERTAEGAGVMQQTGEPDSAKAVSPAVARTTAVDMGGASLPVPDAALAAAAAAVPVVPANAPGKLRRRLMRIGANAAVAGMGLQVCWWCSKAHWGGEWIKPGVMLGFGLFAVVVLACGLLRSRVTRMFSAAFAFGWSAMVACMWGDQLTQLMANTGQRWPTPGEIVPLVIYCALAAAGIWCAHGVARLEGDPTWQQCAAELSLLTAADDQDLSAHDGWDEAAKK